ncbi:MAG: WbqC family protein [Bacteroidota bacterium]
MKSLVHPSSFPNIATLSVVVQEEVIWEIHDNFQKQTYRNRYHICTDQGLHKLSIPIKHSGGENGRQKYKDVRIESSYRWQLQHWRTLQTAYRTSPFFEFYEDELAPLFERPFKFLLDFNWKSIDFLIGALQIELHSQRNSSYEKDFQKGGDYRFLVNSKKGVPFTFEPYNQVFGDRHGFISNTSTLDLLFNEGPNTMVYLKNLSLSPHA